MPELTALTSPEGDYDATPEPTFSPIARIHGSQVLGEFQYDISYEPHSDSLSADDDRLCIIYAENGSGKTNLMKAVYLLCTPDLEALQALIDIPVGGVSIEFKSGALLKFRRSDEIDSFFDLQLQIGGETADSFDLTVRPEDFGSKYFRRTLEKRNDYTSYLSALRALGSFAVFTGDDRLVLSALPKFGARVTDASDDRDYDREIFRSGRAPRVTHITELSDAVDRVESEFRRAAIAGLSDDSPGEGGGVYASISRTIMRGSDETLESAAASQALKSRASEILDRGAGFEKYGLINLAQVRAISKIVNDARANDRHFPQLHSIIDPYLASVSGRLDSLSQAQLMIETFVTSVNSFIDPKVLSFTMGRGIQLRDRRARTLNNRSLSSGEKHLLILLCNAVLAARTGGLMLIDEPELSLGLPWQRELLRQLLQCTSGSEVQFLVASHSAQIIGNRSRVAVPYERSE